MFMMLFLHQERECLILNLTLKGLSLIFLLLITMVILLIKRTLCKKLGVEYVVLERIPEPGLPARSSSGTKREMRFPYRLCLAGGWIDQPWVSEIYPGSVVVAQIWPTMDFNDRSGLATSSREVGIKIWGDRYPDGDPVENAKILFGAENPPGTKYISGSQDHIGLLMPGVNRLILQWRLLA